MQDGRAARCATRVPEPANTRGGSGSDAEPLHTVESLIGILRQLDPSAPCDLAGELSFWKLTTVIDRAEAFPVGRIGYDYKCDPADENDDWNAIGIVRSDRIRATTERGRTGRSVGELIALLESWSSAGKSRALVLARKARDDSELRAIKNVTAFVRTRCGSVTA